MAAPKYDIQALKVLFPKRVEEQNSWFIPLIAIFSTAGHFQALRALARYLQDNEDWNIVAPKFKESIAACFSAIGIPKTLESVYQVGEEVPLKDFGATFFRKGWMPGPENRAKALQTMRKVFGEEINPMAEEFLSEPPSEVEYPFHDIYYYATNIVYGLSRSYGGILTLQESELFATSSLLVQKLPRESGWHLKGCQRNGVSYDELVKIRKIIGHVSLDMCGIDLSDMPWPVKL